MPTVPPSSSDLRGEVGRLEQALASVAEANANAAELMVDLELARARLEEQNRALDLAKRAAEESDRCKSIFLATMSHELRTPLNAIIGYSEMLEEDARGLGETQMASDLVRIHSAAKHLLGLINDILDFSKLEAGRLVLRPDAVLVRAVINTVMETVDPLAKQKGNTLTARCAEADLRVIADPLRMTQCLLNLASNAAKFTTNGEVAIEASLEDQFVRVDVRDSGIGIPSEFLDHLFEPFRQAEGSEIRTQNGTGLGLAISRKLARLMGGDITVESEAGSGSTFTLRLPATASF